MSDLWRFDYQYSSWRQIPPTGPQPSPRAFTTLSTVTVNGKAQMVMMGGRLAWRSLCIVIHSDMWVLNAQTLAWTNVTTQVQGAPVPSLWGHTAAVLDNVIYYFGGSTVNVCLGSSATFGMGPPSGDLYIYDPQTKYLSKVAQPANAAPGTWCPSRGLHVAAAINPGSADAPSAMMVAGGICVTDVIVDGQPAPAVCNDTWLYTPNTSTWRLLPQDRPFDRFLPSQAAVTNMPHQQVWSFGGMPSMTDFVEFNASSATFVFTSSTLQWQLIEYTDVASWPPGCTSPTLAAVTESIMVFFGGFSFNGQLDNTWFGDKGVKGGGGNLR